MENDNVQRFAEDCATSENAHLKLDADEMMAFAAAIKKMRPGQEARLYNKIGSDGLPVAYFVVCDKTFRSAIAMPAVAARGEAQVFNLTNPCPPICD